MFSSRHQTILQYFNTKLTRRHYLLVLETTIRPIERTLSYRRLVEICGAIYTWSLLHQTSYTTASIAVVMTETFATITGPPAIMTAVTYSRNITGSRLDATLRSLSLFHISFDLNTVSNSGRCCCLSSLSLRFLFAGKPSSSAPLLPVRPAPP